MAKDCVRSLEPSLLIGPDDITQGQDRSSKPNSRPIHCSNDGLLELDECVDESSEDNRKHTGLYIATITKQFPEIWW